MRNLNTTANEINNDLNMVEALPHLRKISFTPDPKKLAQEVKFSMKINKPNYPDIIFKGNPVEKGLLPKAYGNVFLIVILISINILKRYLV